MGRKPVRRSSTNRYLRKRRTIDTAQTPKSLINNVGLTERPTVEQLERRQMLFSMTVTPDLVDPVTGLGTVNAFFSYIIPYIGTNIDIPDPQDPQGLAEDFSDEPYGVINPGGRTLLASGIRVSHNVFPATDVSITANPQTQDNQDRWLQVNQNSGGEFVRFQFLAPPDDANATPLIVDTAQFTITGLNAGDNTGLLTDAMRVDLTRGTAQTVIASFTGAALRALIAGNAALGTGVLNLQGPADDPGFDAVRITMIGVPPQGVNTAYRITDIAYTFTEPRFAALLEDLQTAARVTLTGPVGATATFADLYGRDMLRTLILGRPQGQGRMAVDTQDNGIPDFNDGIGSIRLANTDSRTALSIWGGTVEFFQGPVPPDADFVEGNWVFRISASLTGLYDDFESKGFAYAFDIPQGQTDLRFAGLPPGPGSVIIGSPFVRSQNNYNPGGIVPGVQNPVTTGFNNPNQGIFVEDGGNIASVYVHGILHGSSKFNGFVDRLYVGYLVGSVSVNGDLGSLITGTDAGQWAPDPGFTLTNPNLQLDPINKTGSQLVVGRTMGEMAVAGRNLVDVMVIGDLNNPATRPPRDVFTYYEKEFVLGINPTRTVRDAVNTLMANNAFVARTPQAQFNDIDQPMVFGSSFFRNDQIMGAEWVGSISSGVRIKGTLSGRDPTQGEDTNDVFAFAADGTQEIGIEGATNSVAPYIRIVDEQGRVLAAPQLTDVGTVTRLRFTPKGPGVYYVVIADPSDGTTADTGFGNVSYTIAITGMAVTTMGALRSGGGAGFTDINTGEGNSVQVLAGNIGSLRIGTGVVVGGAVAGPVDYINTVQEDDEAMSWYGGAFSTPGTLYNITTGSDIGNPSATGGGNGISVIVGGDFGTLFTGLAPLFGTGSDQGDLNFFRLQVGGRIASINVRGGIGVDQDPPPRGNLYDPIGSFSSITSGTAGGSGDIGFIRIGANIAGDSLEIRTSPGSIIGAFLVAQDPSAAPITNTGIFQGLEGVPIFTGAGSDVRFVDTPRVDLIQSVDVTTPIIGGQVVELTDDGGSRVQISVENALDGAFLGAIRVLPIDGSQGVAIGRITVNLTGGATLRIKSLASGVGTPVSIGRIEIVGSGAASAIQIDGQVRVDVYQVISAGGLDNITNTTGGDMVAIDVAGLNTLELRGGDLGRTEVPAWGPTLIGPFLGLAGGLVGAVGGPLGVGFGIADNAYYFGWTGGPIFRPLNAETYAIGAAFLEDIGSPLDGYLNGLVVRASSVQSVQVTGNVGDIILQAAGAQLVSVRANSDRITPVDRFEGISGHIFAFDIVDIDIGDGLKASVNSPLQSTGIVALNDIQNITSNRTSGAIIESTVNALSARIDNIGDNGLIDGIGTLQLTNGIIRDANITAMDLDGFWASFHYADGVAPTGNLGNIRLTNTTFFRSRGQAININNFLLSGPNGFFDASELAATGLIDKVSATGFRNSTLTGTLEEIAVNRILGARDLNSLTATQDISDLTVDITGSVRQSISAVNISRSVLEIDGEIKALTVTNDIRGSSINVGNLPSVTIGRNLQSSSVSVSGQLTKLSAGNQIANSAIAVTGPGGTIGTITAPNLISGTISSAGNIGSVIVTAGDLIATVSTTNGGAITTLSAGRDLNINGDVSGSVGTLTAGRNFGDSRNPSVFLVRGNLTSASVANGQLYSDIRVGQSAGVITVGSASNKVGANFVGTGSIIAFGSIATVTINGDFDGDIISYSGGIATIAITNGSLLPGNTIAAYNASIASLTITNGSLYGNVHADNDITLLRVVAGADGVFGDIGVNPTSSPLVSYDSRRNQLPLGVAPNASAQGPVISAGRNIVSVQVPGGSVFETYFVAGQNINSIVIAGTVQNDFNTVGISSAFIAGDSIDLVTISGGVNNTAFVSGIVSLGADGRLGGTGADADTLKSGSIKTINISNGMVDGKFSAGIDPGFDGVYNTSDDRSVQGISTIGNINLTGPVGNVSVFADVLPSNIANDNRFTRGGTNLTNTNPQIDSGSGTPGTSFSGSRTFNNVNGANLTFNFSGPGQAFFNPATGILTLRNTTSGTNVTVSSSTGVINNIKVVTNDDASLGNVTFNGRVTGDSDLIVDGNVAALTYGDFEGTGTISIGGDVTTVTFANFKGGFFDAKSVPTFRINGQFGDLNTTIFNEAKIQLLSAGVISIGGQAAGVISVDRDATSLTVSGAVDRAAFRFGRSLGAFTSPNFSRSFLSAGDNIGPITIGGDVFQSNISAGADLGRDAAPGGTGFNADTLSSGNIGAVMIAGNFSQSSLTAGYLRGPDGFFGTSDDLIAGGRSTIASVTIGGTQTGSARGSESFRIASNGTLGPVTIGGQAFNGTRGNFALETLNLQPNSLQVADLSVVVTSGVSTANLTFNQPVDSTSISAALSVSEVRGSGDVTVRLVEGIDYTVSYDNVTNTARVQFSTSVTSRNLPIVPGVPGPGVYRFELDQQKIRARLTGIQLDGDGDGMADVNDDFSGDTIVGDAGDRITPGVVLTGPNGTHRVDLYGPTSLDFVLDNNKTSDGLPDPNVTYTVRGFIGDHPDNDVNFFRFGGDLDVYSITLQAGQILRLGALAGTAVFAPVTVFDPNGIAFNNDSMVAIFTDRTDVNALTFGSDFLIKQTGTYLIAVGNSQDIADSTVVTNPPAPPGGVGAYNFTVTIFDDGDSGFNAPTDAGNGSNVVNAPAPSVFAGNDQVFGTADDLPSITIGAFVFTYSKGADNLPNTADDIVTGASKDATIVSTRDGTGRMVSTISSAIGPVGHAGVPSESAADVDVFRLNNGQPITPGTRMTITVKLTDLGADLGSASFGSTGETRGAVQFALFDISNATNIDDGTLVFSPTDFTANGGPKNTVLASNGSTTYGYDANGDFYITFNSPDRLDLPGNAASLAVYIQGIRNTDYQIEVVTHGTAPVTTRQTQNFLIETNGGVINWLEAGNQSTTLRSFTANTLGFTGTINGIAVQDYIINNVIAQLNGLFQSGGPGTGFDVHFSANPADFEFQPMSTVFLSSEMDPINPIFNPFAFEPFAGFGGASTVVQPYGYSQHSDALNADLEDEAVVFVPGFALQGFSPSRQDVDQFVQATTAAIARRAGELMGLRISEAYDPTTTTFDPFAANSVDNRPGAGRAYTLPNFNRGLSDALDSVTRTDFYLGQQNARSLLDKVLTRI